MSVPKHSEFKCCNAITREEGYWLYVLLTDLYTFSESTSDSHHHQGS